MTRIASHIIAQCFVIGSAAIASGFTDITFPESAAIFALVWIGRFYGEEIYGNMKDAGNGRAGTDFCHKGRIKELWRTQTTVCF